MAAWTTALVVAAASGAHAEQVCEPPPASRSMPTERFDEQGDGTVIDRGTKLMWTRCALGQTWSQAGCAGPAAAYTWDAAQSEAQALNRSGRLFYNDWRLPQIRELATITERACRDPRTNLAVFPGTDASWYWSVTVRPGGGSTASVYAMSFGAEGVQLLDKDERARVRLVRSAQ